jgi:predicted Fe-Mo cluster-binding NifX family protein
MKLAIPAEAGSPDSAVCPSFGRTPFFALYDTETGHYEFLDNSAAASEGGAGIKAAQLLVDCGANAVITFRCGNNAAQVLNAAALKLYRAQEGTVSENIEKFSGEKLSPLSEIHPGFHSHGGGPE